MPKGFLGLCIILEKLLCTEVHINYAKTVIIYLRCRQSIEIWGNSVVKGENHSKGSSQKYGIRRRPPNEPDTSPFPTNDKNHITATTPVETKNE
jgi:hypothetical protein